MKKRNVLILIIILFVFIIGGIVVFYNHNNKINCSKDALKFKQNYEKYNGNMIKYNNKSYKLRNLDISKDNPIIYLKKSDVVKRLKKGTEVVLFGNESDLFTREAIPVLFDVANEFDCDIVYYYDSNNISKDNELYKEVINIIGNKRKDTVSKYFTTPVLIFIKEGKIVDYHEGLVDSYDDYTKSLSENQKRELARIYRNRFNSINNGVCERKQQC